MSGSHRTDHPGVSRRDDRLHSWCRLVGALASDRPRVAAAGGAAAARRRSRQLLGHGGDRDRGAAASADQGVGEVLDVDQQVARRGLDRDGPDPDRAWVRRQRSARPRDRGAPQGRMYRDLSRGHTVARSSAAGPRRRRPPGAGGAGGDDRRGRVQRHGRDPAVPQSTPARAGRVLRVRPTRDRARGVTAAVQHPAAGPAPSACTDRGRGPQARRALAGRVPTWSPELAITGKPGGKGASRRRWLRPPRSTASVHVIRRPDAPARPEAAP